MGERENGGVIEFEHNSEIKILIDALKYTSNIIVELTNRLTFQDNKINDLNNVISDLDNKILKIQKLTMENNLKLKSIDLDKINELLTHYENNQNIKEYVVEENKNLDDYSKKIYLDKNNHLNKNKIDKLIGSIVKRKNLLEEQIDHIDHKDYYIIETGNTQKNENDKTLDINTYVNTGSNTRSNIKSNTVTNTNTIDYTKHIEKTNNIEDENENITNAQNNDLNKANNILKQIRKRSNFARKF